MYGRAGSVLVLSVLAALMAICLTGCGAATPAVESPTSNLQLAISFLDKVLK